MEFRVKRADMALAVSGRPSRSRIAREVPGRAVIAAAIRVVATAGNRTRELADPTATPKMLAIREACQKLSSERLTGHDLYVTLGLAPCAPAPFLRQAAPASISGAGDEREVPWSTACALYLADLHHVPDIIRAWPRRCGLLSRNSSGNDASPKQSASVPTRRAASRRVRRSPWSGGSLLLEAAFLLVFTSPSSPLRRCVGGGAIGQGGSLRYLRVLGSPCLPLPCGAGSRRRGPCPNPPRPARRVARSRIRHRLLD